MKKAVKKIRSKRNFNNLDGEVIDRDIMEAHHGASGTGEVEVFEAKNASADVGNSFDDENFYPASGGEDGAGKIGKNEEDEFRSKMYSDATGAEDMFGEGTIFDQKERERRASLSEAHSNLFGWGKSKKQKAIDSAAKNKRKQTEADAKLIQAKAANAAATSLNDQSGDVAQAQALQALAASPTGVNTKKGLSTEAKVGIALGVTALLTVITIIVVKKMKNKKK